ncbi:DNA internalization-related competence protein ComEC/Rec2 [Desulfocurvibacter africanus PCS]|uniref:DNA internalization-related competence protein ComEC/Rec2 n=1 Tax=Desulfocurvibacter africanus PCS TaxID=1262666 RepID=M5Q317_DESAF|nr:DNA internalization-related competence protein ComEC/Rec2 [Desulfocurvibacter africanus]EMG37888.1 DNA internalization-related competence protein ComEC/Rec2 [Desulfocurvibacter africanus PCS]
MPRTDPITTRRSTAPPLLPWQVHLLALVLGILAYRHSLAAGFCAGLLYVAVALVRGRWSAPLPYLLAFALGLLLAWWRMPTAPLVEPEWMLAGEKVRVAGRVLSVEAREDQRLQIVLDQVRCSRPTGAFQDLPGRLVWTWQYPGAWPGPGQDVSFTAKVWPARSFANPGAWDTRFYWARQGVFHRAYARGQDGGRGADVRLAGEASWSWQTRLALRERLLELTEPLEGSQGRALLMALIMGDRFLLDRATREDMADASLAHTLALSGLHLGIVAGMGWLAAWIAGHARPSIHLRLPRPRLAVLLGLPPVLLYLWLGGATPSLLRAAVMYASWGLLLWLGRGRVLLDGLFLAVALILAWNPLMAFDLGLQMSAVAVAGMALTLPRFFSWAEALADSMAVAPNPLRKTLRFLAKSAAVTVAANLALLPIVLANFGQIGVGLYWNLLWVPLLGLLIMPLGFCGMLLALLPALWPAAAQCLSLDAAILEALTDLLTAAKHWGLTPVLTASIPLWPQMAGYWLLLAYLFVRRGLTPDRERVLVLLVFVLLAGPTLWQNLQPVRSLRLTMLDVGQGQCILLETPQGRRYLIDGGGTTGPGFDVGEAVVAKVLARNAPAVLDGIILSHADTDHARGLIHIVRNFRVGFFASNGEWGDSAHAAQLREALADKGVEQRQWRAGQAYRIGQDVVLEAVHPVPDQDDNLDLNDSSLALRLVWCGKGLALLPGDLQQPGLGALLARVADLRCEALILPHHGSDSSLSPELYQRASPRLALASSGYLNRWGFPGPEVREALAESRLPLWTTADCGAMTLSWDDPAEKARLETYLACQPASAQP